MTSSGVGRRLAPSEDEGEATATWEDELEALRTCVEALLPLNLERQRRILGAVQCMIDGESAVQVLRAWHEARKCSGGGAVR